jgi:hypothetical protein
MIRQNERIDATAKLERPDEPAELHLKLRLPNSQKPTAITVNGQPAQLGGVHGDTVVIQTAGRKVFEVRAAG